MPKRTYRTVWISDMHLGSRGSRAAELARFLKRIRCETLFLVGDFIDFWRLRSRPHWPHEHHEVLRRLLKHLKRGTRIIIVPGNHDAALREYVGLDFGGISICDHHVHETADNRRLLVTHGDQYDLVVTHSRLLAILGSRLYEWLLAVNRHYNRYRAWRGKSYWSLSQYLKLRVKSACTFISRFQETLLHEARRQGLDGVVCGHIHKPEILEGDVTYMNCGDWVESCTALVESETGEIRLIRFDHLECDPQEEDAADSPADDVDDLIATLMDAQVPQGEPVPVG
jgi:UDP-2,3-diacylglucosamine pyrophosphatase LpxH